MTASLGVPVVVSVWTRKVPVTEPGLGSRYTSGYGESLLALCAVCTLAHCLVRAPDTELPSPGFRFTMFLYPLPLP